MNMAGMLFLSVPCVLLFVVLFGLIVLLFTSRTQKGRALSRIPGPRFASLTRLWILKSIYSYGFSEKCVKLSKKYGPVTRIGPNHVLLSDPAEIRKVLAVGSIYTRGPWFDALKPHHDATNIVCERDPKKHQQKRNILGIGLSGKASNTQETTIDHHVQAWVERLHKCYTSKNEGTIDIMRSFRLLAVDILSHLMIGKPLGSSKADKDVRGFISLFLAGTKFQMCLSVLPEVKNILVFLSKVPLLGRVLISLSPGDGNQLVNMLAFIQEVVDDRYSDRGPKVEMLDSFIARAMAKEEAALELLILMSAGIETTTTGVEALIFLILTTPGVLSNLMKEIDELVARDSDFPVKQATLRAMPYFQACVSEGLRIYPPSFQLRERITPPTGDQLGEYFVPGGTFIGISSKAAQLANVVGDDIESFRPDRWLSGDKEKLAQMNRDLELVFNYGSTKCLGLNIALMMLNKVVFELFRNFDVALDPLCKTHGSETVPRKLLLRLRSRRGQLIRSLNGSENLQVFEN